MKKYSYWSKTNRRYIKIYAVVGKDQVQLFYDDLAEFKLMSKSDWNEALHKGTIKLGWE